MKKKIIILIIIVIIIFINLLTFYKFSHHVVLKSTEPTKKEVTIGDEIILNVEDYEKNILPDNTSSIKYKVFNDTTVVYGEIYIDSLNTLCISEYVDPTKKVLNNIKVKSMHNMLMDDDNGIDIYVISTNYELYHITLNKPFLSDISIKKSNINGVISFTDLKIKSIFDEYNGVIVLTKNNELYDASNEFKYNSCAVNIHNDFIIANEEIYDTNGKKLTNEKKESYIFSKMLLLFTAELDNESIPDIFNVYDGLYADDEVFNYEPPYGLLLTKTNQVLYKMNNKIYVYNSKYTSIDDNAGSIVIKFENGETLKCTGMFFDDYNIEIE